MARTVAEIKKIIADKYVGYEEVKQAYQLEGEVDFEKTFSKVSLESILFYVVAFVCWTLETLFDKHREECLGIIDNKKPHRLKWYRNKALEYQYNGKLKLDSDEYESIDESKQVVKYAAVLEQGGEVYIKVAGEDQYGKRGQLETEYYDGLKSYFAEIKDAGVKIRIFNQPPDEFSCSLDIYYNPMVLTVSRRDEVKNAIKDYIENLPFNGEYSNMALVDVLQNIEGVVIPELKYSKYRYGGQTNFTPINAKVTPDSGYFCIKDEQADLHINWIAYNTI